MSLSKELKVFMKLTIADKKKFLEYGKQVELKAKARNNGKVYMYSEAGNQYLTPKSPKPHHHKEG